VSHGGIKIVQNLFDKGTRLETGSVILAFIIITITIIVKMICNIVMIIIFNLLFTCFKLTTVVVSTTDFTDLEKHKLYNPNQSGFRKNRNTMEQCIRLENDIQKSFVNKYITVK
jgi:hypothetical protein